MPAAPLPAFEQERLKALSSMDLLDTGRSQTFDDFVEVASKMMRAPIAAISLVAEKRQWFKAIRGLPGITETPRDLAFCGYTILDPARPFVISDAINDPRVADNKLVTGKPSIRSYAGAPLLTRDNLPIGALCVLDIVPRAFREEDLDRLTSLARMISRSLRLHGAIHALEKRRRATEG